MRIGSKVTYTLRNGRHAYLRTLCAQWLRKHKPIVYRLLSKRAAGKFPPAVKDVPGPYSDSGSGK